MKKTRAPLPSLENKELMRAMLDLRNGSRTSRIPSKKRYTRVTKHRKKAND